jgi:hypothetical protein
MILELKTADAFESLMTNPYRTLKTHNITAKGGDIYYKGSSRELPKFVSMVDDYFITTESLHYIHYAETYPPNWRALISKLLKERNGVGSVSSGNIKHCELADVIKKHLLTNMPYANKPELWAWYWEYIYTYVAREITDGNGMLDVLGIPSPWYLFSYSGEVSPISVAGPHDLISKVRTLESIYRYESRVIPKPFGMEFTEDNIHKLSALHEIAEMTIKNFSP